MRKLVMAIAALLTLAAPTLANAVGLGASVNSHENAIYVPFDVTPGLWLEPYFAYAKVKDDTGGVTTETRSMMLGVGAFVHRAPIEPVEVYAGGRLAFVDEKQSVGAPVNFTADEDGFALEPTIGAAYGVTPSVSVAIEAFLHLSDLDGSAGTTKTTETGNRILLRIMLPRQAYSKR